MIDDAAFWAVLSVCVAVHWALPARLRPSFLAAASFGFLALLDARSLLSLLVLSLVVYGTAARSRRGDRLGRLGAVAVVLLLLAHLAWFKYVPPLLRAFATSPESEEVLLPLGISYFTFKLIHFVVEVRRGRIEPPRPADFLLWVFFFPIFVAGPIERFDHFMAERDSRLTREALAEGGTRIVHGLVKKFAIAELLVMPMLRDPSAAELVETLPDRSSLVAWRHVACYFAFAYLDFSAYTDVAVGASRLFGLRVMENFNYPFLARNISDFWTRWHMTLAGWCRTYVYLPLLGWSRSPYLAVYALMAAIGVWHAGNASWLFWGLYHATGIAVYGAWSRFRRRRRRPPKRGPGRRALGIAVTLAFVCGSYAFPVTAEHGGLPAGFRLLAKLLGLDL